MSAESNSSPEKLYAMYEALIESSIVGLSEDSILERIGFLIDMSLELGREDGTALALKWCDELEKAGLAGKNSVLLDYFRANAWANRSQDRTVDREGMWKWTQPEIQNQIYFLRRAVSKSEFASLDAHRRCQIHTNLGNQLNVVGRFIEAIDHWEKALEIDPSFGMACGNLGLGILHYAEAHYDDGQKFLFARFANEKLTRATDEKANYSEGINESARSAFKKKLASLKHRLGTDFDFSIDDGELNAYSLGESSQEVKYRHWCLANKLFLNPLNDICTMSIAAQDSLSQPNIHGPATSVGPPEVIGFFSQLKQEFVSARWQFFEGTHNAGKVHFSDRDVLLYNTLDYPSYSLWVERVKSAYRATYSIFDKIGIFLNCYFDLKVEERKVSFRKIWFEPKLEPPTVRSKFDKSENWPLRGLYWLSKDLFESELQDVAAPEAKALHEIRNHLEHKFLRIQEMSPPQLACTDESPGIGFPVLRSDFENKALHLLKLCRAALIYLALAMEAEERRRTHGGLSVPMELGTWDDDWKR